MTPPPKPKVTIYRDRRKNYRWRFEVNGRIMADSGEGYAKESNAWRAWDAFVRHITRRNYRTMADELKDVAKVLHGVLDRAREMEADS